MSVEFCLIPVDLAHQSGLHQLSPNVLVDESCLTCLITQEQTTFTKSAPVVICYVFCNRCNIRNPSTATRSISDKEIKEVIPADFFRRDLFYFLLCPLYKERVLLINQRGVIVSLWLLLVLLQRCFLKQFSCSFFNRSKNPTSTIRLQSLLYHFIVNFVSFVLTVNNLLWCLLGKYFSSDKVLNWPYSLFSKSSSSNFKASSSFNTCIPCQYTWGLLNWWCLPWELEKTNLYSSFLLVVVQVQVLQSNVNYGCSGFLLYFITHVLSSR